MWCCELRILHRRGRGGEGEEGEGGGNKKIREKALIVEKKRKVNKTCYVYT